jgi:apolipoprotein N-acyltransferase
VLQQLPQHQQAILLGMARGYTGITPYVRWGNAAVMLLIMAMLAFAFLRRMNPHENSGTDVVGVDR